MESHTAEHFEAAANEGEAGTPSSSACVQISLILRKILEHIPNAELVKFSHVNKQWNYEARCVLRDRGSLIASLKSCKPCRNLEAFVSDLREMNVVPFSGIRLNLITNFPRDNCQKSWESPPTKGLDFMRHFNFDRLSCKFFHIIINNGYWSLFGGSQAFAFIQKVLKDFGTDLEEFTITPEDRHEGFLEGIFLDCSFPNLKKITFKGPYSLLHDYLDNRNEYNRNTIKSVISCAPNLEELHVAWDDSLETMMGGSPAVVVPFHSFDPFYLRYSESFICKLRLQNIVLHEINFCSVERFNRIIPLFLTLSSTTLAKMTINPISVLPLMCYGISFEKMIKLKIDAGYRRELLRHDVAELLKTFDFTRIFPNLKHVKIIGTRTAATSGQIRYFVSQAQAALVKPILPDRAANIKELSLLEMCLIGNDFATFFTELFPSTERLSVLVSEELEFAFEQIWKHWMDLKELEVRFRRRRDSPRVANLDSLFCGVFPEEVAELRKMDDEYLKCVNIVPVIPSFVSLKNLRKFRFAFEDDPCLGVGRQYNPTFIFSKVTGWITFARCPTLSVTIEHNRRAVTRVLSHMKPFASVGKIK